MTQDPGQPMTTPSTQSVPEPPRPITATVRRRCWAEPQVRGWVLFAAALLLGSLFLAVRSFNEWRDETKVVRDGKEIEAVAWHSGGARVKGMSLTSTDMVEIEYTYPPGPDGKKYHQTGQLPKTNVEYVSLEPFKIRVDPDDPNNWTARTDAPPAIEKMMGVGIVLSIAAVCAVVMLLQRQRCRSLWVHGDHVTARIIGRSQPALAPHSVGLRCVMRVGKVEHVVSVYVPQDRAPSEGVQTIDLIASADRSRALALCNYHP